MLVPKADSKVRICLDLARLNKVLIRLIQRGLTFNNILPRLAGVKYLIPINVRSVYHNLNLDEQSSYLQTFSCPFGRYRYIKPPFSVALAGNMFHRRIDELFQGLPNVFGIANDILIAGLNNMGRDTEQGGKHMQTGQPKAQQRQVPIQVFKHPILQ